MTITLEAARTVAGSAGTGSAITCSIFGDELTSAGADDFKLLDQRQLPVAATTLYAVPTGESTIIKQITLANTTASPIAVAMFVGGTAAGNRIWSGTIPANGSATYDGKWTTYDAAGAQQYVGATGPTGPRGATYRGAYAGGTTYAIDDVVFDNGSSWIAISAGSGTAPPTLPTTSNARWSLLSAKGDQGIQGIQGVRGATWRGAYAGGTPYAVDDLVSNQNSTWINISASTGVAPPTLPTTSNANWSLVARVGDQGIQGEKGWSPILSVVSDGERRVLQIVNWTGGQGTMPSTTNQFIGPSGIVNSAAAAVDIRGATGATGSATAPNAVDNTMLRDSAATSVIGRAAGTSGDPADIAASADDQMLRRTGGTLGFGGSTDGIHGSRGGGNLHANAVAAGAAGFMTGADKTKLDALPSSAPPTTRAITAGAGLTGGGDLTADRDIAFASDDPALEVLADNVRWRHAYGGLVTGANRTYTLADRHKIFTRSNSDLAMTDTLPTMAAGDAGWSVIIHNLNGSAAGATGSLTINAGGTNTFLHDGSQSHVMHWGTRQTYVWTGSNWVFSAGNTNLTRFSGVTSVTPNAVPKFNDATGRVISDSLVSINYIANPLNKLGKLDVLWIDVVADFGADPTGQLDSTTAIRNAIAAAGTLPTPPAGQTMDPAARWPMTIYFPTGTYRITSTIGVNKPVRLVGGGRGICVIRIYDPTLSMFHLSASAAGAGFEQLRFTGDDSVGAGGTGGQYRTGRPQSTTIAAGSNGYTIPIGGFSNYTLNVGSTAGMPAATPANPQVVNFQSRFGGVTYWDSVAYTGQTATTLTGVTGAAPAQQRSLQTGDLITWGGYAVDLGGAANAYLSECDILFHKNGVRSAGGLQFLNDLNIRETNNVNNDTSEATASACIAVEGYGDRYIRRITTDNADDWLWFAGIRVRECASCVIVDSNVINANWALDIAPNQGANHAVASVMAVNTFWDSSSIGCRIRAVSASDTAHRIRFIQCWFSTMNKIQPTTGGHHAGGVGATIEHANVTSIDFIACDFFQNTNVGLDAPAAGDWSVRASRFSGNGTGVRTAGGTANHRFSISDNFIGNGGGFGANGLGINIQAGTYLGYQISDNRGLDSNTTPGITDNGTVAPPGEKVIRDNIGTGANTHEVGSTSSFTMSTAGTVVLQFPIVAANLRYGFDVQIHAHIAATNATGVGVGFQLPAGATMEATAMGPTSTAATASPRTQYFTASASALTASAQYVNSFITSTGMTGQIRISGAIIGGASTGMVSLIARAQTTATVRAGTWMRAMKL